MINTGLDAQFDAKEQNTEQSYELMPEGGYDVKVTEIKPWQKRTKDVYVNTRDGQGNLLRDGQGNLIKELHKNLDFYTCDVKLKVVSGAYKGRTIFASLTTHPNAQFITEGFLFAVNKTGLTASAIPAACINLTLSVETEHDTYNKKVTDKISGVVSEEPVTKLKVTSFQRPSHLVETDEEELEV